MGVKLLIKHSFIYFWLKSKQIHNHLIQQLREDSYFGTSKRVGAENTRAIRYHLNTVKVKVKFDKQIVFSRPIMFVSE